MKKQFLSLLLVMLVIPSMFLFSGCKEDSYKLSQLKTDYNNMVSGCENIKYENNKIIFDYSNHVIGSNQFMNNVIQTEPYNQINNYNILFDNLMGFVYEYIDACSNNNINASAEVRNNLKAQIDDLSLSLRSVDVYINQWAETIEFNYNEDIYNIQCLSRYKNLLFAYNELYQKAISFSNSVASLYYNNALNDSNPKIDNMELASFDATIIVAKLQGRVKYQISNLSQIFVEKYVDGLNLENSITTKTGEVYGKLNLNQDNYLSNINSLKRAFSSDFDAETIATIANGTSKKQTFYNYSIQAYNFQNVLDNDNNMFALACNKIQYGKIEGENRHKSIIDNYNNIVQQYNVVLTNMLDSVGL